MTYETFLGLWLNRQRQMIRQGYSVSIGVAMCFGGTKGMPEEVMAALSDSDQEADNLKAVKKEWDGRVSGRSIKSGEDTAAPIVGEGGQATFHTESERLSRTEGE